jgi:hypothetical protein
MLAGMSASVSVAGVAEHHALVACALLLVEALTLGDALRDVGGLLLDRHEDRAGAAVEAHARVRVADVELTTSRTTVG